MKKLLILLYALLPVLAQAQLISNPRAQIRDSLSLNVLYEVTTDVPKNTYPASEAGYAQFNLDVKAGKWNLTLDNGALISKGTLPPYVAPMPTGLVGPTWASLLYTMNGQELYVEGAGSDLAKLRFQLVNGTSITGTNPNGVNLNDQTFYGFGDNGSTSYPKQWRATFTPSIIGQNFRITAQRSNGELFVKEFVPAAGANKVQLYLASGSGNNSPPTSTTTATPVTVAYDQSVESESATLSNSGQDVFTFDDGGSSGSKIACCFSRSDTYIDYTLTGIPGPGTLTLELRYQTNTDQTATASIVVGGQTQSLSLPGTSGGKSTKTISIPVTSGSNTIRIAGTGSGTFLQDKIRVYGSITTGSSSGGGTTTPPTSGNVVTTYPSYTIGGMLGNSITTYRASTVPNEWPYNNAMAVTAPEFDNAHIVEAGLKTVNQSFKLVTWGYGSGLEQYYNFTQDPQAVDNNISALKSDIARDYPNTQFNPFIFSFGGENTGGTFDATLLRAMFDKVLAAVPRPAGGKVIFRTSFYKGKDQTDAFVRTYCAEKGYDYVDLSDVQERSDLSATEFASQNAGWAKHPGKSGHALIGSRFLDKLKTTSSGGGSSTPAPNTYAFTNPNTDYVAVQDQGWLNQDQKFFDNGTVKIGILDAGGVIATARLMSNDRGLINTFKTGYNDDPADPRYNTITYDLGRSWMPASDYFSPDPDVGYAFKTKNADGSFKNTKTGYKGNVFNTGGNTVQGGSLWPALTKSPILASARYTHPTRGDEVYVKTRPAIWGVKGELGNIIVEEWINFPRANVVHVYTRHTVIDRDPNQVDEQRLFRAREQENPCIYTIANLTQHLINLPGQGRKNIWPGNQNNPSFSSTYHTSDCKIGAYEGDGGTGLTLYSPMNSAFKSGHFGATQGGEYDSQASYINGASRMNYDNPGIYDDENFVVVGTESDANAAIPQLPGIDQSFSFDFAKENMRWWNVDSRLIRESGNNWTWYLDSKVDNGQTSYQCKFQSPWRAWTASNITSISFEMAVTNASQLDMIWEQPGPDNQPNYTKRFSVTGDGQFRTYTVSTSDPNWNGIITNVGLRVVNGAVSNGAKVIIRRIYKN